MSVRRLAEEQPESFAFTPENMAWAKDRIAKYPEGRQASAVIPLLWKAQEQHDGWLPEPAIRYVAEMLEMPQMRVYEIATFYTMFNLHPVGEHFVQLCGTTPCMLRGAEDLKAVCRKVIGPETEVRADGKFSWLEVECLGACTNAPMVQINDDFYEDLTPESFEKLLDDLAAGREVTVGPQNGRMNSAPLGGPTTLSDPSLYDGSMVGAWRKTDEPTAPANDDAPAAEGAAPSRPPAPAPAPATPPAGSAKAEEATAPAAGSGVDAASEADGDESAEASAAVKELLAENADAAEKADAAGARPSALGPEHAGDGHDLKIISGVGPKLEETLHRLGIYRFEQIAAWTPENVAWVDTFLSFKGRIDRDEWISQAAKLAESGADGKGEA